MADDDDFDAEDMDLPDETETPARPTDPVALPGIAGDEDDDLRSNDEPAKPRHNVNDTPNYQKRVPKAERQIRIATVANMLLQGFHRHDVHAYINDKLFVKWGAMSERSIDRLLEHANKLLASEAVIDVTREKSKATQRFDDLYRKSVGAKMYGTALRIQRAINRMHGLDAPLKFRHGGDPESPLPVNPNAPFIVVIQEQEEG